MIEKDSDGWIDCKKFLPTPYDLVWILVGRKAMRAWWDGMAWCGYKLSRRKRVTKWKKAEERCH